MAVAAVAGQRTVVPAWPAGIELRKWQTAAFGAWKCRSGADFLVEATPGAGKTTFALRIAHELLSSGVAESLVVLCPTSHLRRQWQQAALGFGLQLCTDLGSARRLDPAYHGAVLTYQQLASDPVRFRRIFGSSAVLFDEIHHAGEGRSWGEALFLAFAASPVRLQLSGTPFRSDGTPIPFVRYDDEGHALADYSYGYADALSDSVVRPVFFVAVGGKQRWVRGSEVREHSFGEVIAKDLRSARLRTALAPTGGWMRGTLGKAHRRLLSVRAAAHPDAGGLVVCMDQDHARAVAAELERITGVAPKVALSDDPDASRVISDFAAGREPWVIAVAMISEGSDIPRIRVIVWATNTTAELFFRQVVGRAVRVTREPAGVQQDAFVYLPADDLLVAHAKRLSAERVGAGLAEPAPPDDLLPRRPRQAPDEVKEFRALESEAGAESVVAGGVLVAPREIERAGGLLEDLDLGETEPHELALFVREVLGADGGLSVVGIEDRRRVLRVLLKRRVADYCRRAGRSHRDVYADLMRRGRRPVDQLDERTLAAHIRLVEVWAI